MTERPTRLPFPAVLDSSLIAAFRSCPHKGRLEYFDHWKPRSQSVHLHAGGAWAKAMEVTRLAFYLGEYHIARSRGEYVIETRSPGNSESSQQCGLLSLLVEYGDFPCPPESAKSAERMAGAFEFYFSQYPLAADKAVPARLPGGKAGIEFNFAEPLDFRHPETGDPLLYVGRLDMIADYAGARYGYDDKTTSQLGASWGKQWDLRSQFTGYCWGAARAGIPLAGFIVRGISILKTKYDTAQAITYRPQWMIDQWYEQLIEHDLPAMTRMWESGKWGMNLDHSCNEYGGCTFKQVCLADPPSRGQWLATSFERRKWDPVTREETKL